MCPMEPICFGGGAKYSSEPKGASVQNTCKGTCRYSGGFESLVYAQQRPEGQDVSLGEVAPLCSPYVSGWVMLRTATTARFVINNGNDSVTRKHMIGFIGLQRVLGLHPISDEQHYRLAVQTTQLLLWRNLSNIVYSFIGLLKIWNVLDIVVNHSLYRPAGVHGLKMLRYNFREINFQVRAANFDIRRTWTNRSIRNRKSAACKLQS